jgi:hypothetical protein
MLYFRAYLIGTGILAAMFILSAAIGWLAWVLAA